jgi:hypothetical protein
MRACSAGEPHAPAPDDEEESRLSPRSLLLSRESEHAPAVALAPVWDEK